MKTKTIPFGARRKKTSVFSKVRQFTGKSVQAVQRTAASRIQEEQQKEAQRASLLEGVA